jgi:hypothetical protein
MNFGLINDLEDEMVEEEPEGSSTTSFMKKKSRVKRFESSKFTHSDMFDPDHGPMSEVTESMNKESYEQKMKPDFQNSFGDSSFADRDVIS